MEVKVIKHESNRKGYFVKHKALVEAIGLESLKHEKEDLINRVSIAIGYHPNKYGVYGGKISKTASENRFVIVWETDTL